MSKSTNYELYRQAVDQLTTAMTALDQAHSTLHDIGYEDVLSNYEGGKVSLRVDQLADHTEDVIKELGQAECDDCFHPISEHGDSYGCEYERGDDGRGVAQGPCGCDWGQQQLSPRGAPATITEPLRTAEDSGGLPKEKKENWR